MERHTSPPPHPEHPTSPPAEDGEFSAAAPPHPAAAGTGETSFGDAEAPAAMPRIDATMPTASIWRQSA